MMTCVENISSTRPASRYRVGGLVLPEGQAERDAEEN